jgi:hypothetical protein
MRDIKHERTQLNDIERDDRNSMEKIKFLFEAIAHQELVRRKNQSVDASANMINRTRIAREISEVAQHIGDMLNEKYKVEGEIKQ